MAHNFIKFSVLCSVLGLCRGLEILESPRDLIVSRNEPVTLTCKVRGDPEPSVTWYKDGSAVVTAKDNPASHKILLPDNGLFFLSALHNKKEKDSGVYWCSASNSQGVVTSEKGRLDVAYLERDFLGLPGDYDVSVGSPVQLDCSPPRGNPKPKVIWKKNDRLIDSSDSRYRLEGSSLAIQAVEKSDSGRYQCIAENIAATRETPTVKLGVHEPPYFVVRPPDKTTGVVGSDLLLDCHISGDPSPIVRWNKLYGEIDGNRAKKIVGKGLLIENIHPNDEGVYECSGENTVGKIETKVHLVVQEPPILTVSPEKNVDVEVGVEVKLTCLATGRPSPTIFWSKEGESSVLFPGLKDGNVYVTADGSLKIKMAVVENSGRYVCTAVNDVGAAMSQSHLLVYDSSEFGEYMSSSHLNVYKQSDDHNLDEARLTLQQQLVHINTVQPISSGSVTVSWRCVGGRAFIDGYLLRYRPTPNRYQDFKTLVVTDTSTNSFNLQDLEPDTQYDIFVQPYYRTVVGLPTSIRTVSTEASNIPGPPVILVAEMLNYTTAFVVWQNNKDDRVIGFQVVLKNNESSISTKVDAGISEVYLKLNERDFRRTYEVLVAAVSTEGKGSFSQPATLEPPRGLPITVTQPEGREDALGGTAWLIALIGSLTLMLLVMTSVMLIYRRRQMKCKQRRFLPAPGDIYGYQEKEGWTERAWNSSDCEKDSTASNKKLLPNQYSRSGSEADFGNRAINHPTNVNHQTNRQYPSCLSDRRTPCSDRQTPCLERQTPCLERQPVCSERQTPCSDRHMLYSRQFESPYATTDILEQPYTHTKSGSFCQLSVAPLVWTKQRKDDRPRRFQRESQSFDNLNSSRQSIYAGVHHPPSRYRKSNPNLLDILPPPPVYAPPSLQSNTAFNPSLHADNGGVSVTALSANGGVCAPSLSFAHSTAKHPQKPSARLKSSSSTNRILDSTRETRNNNRLSRGSDSVSLDYFHHLLPVEIENQGPGEEGGVVDNLLRQELRSFHEAVTNFNTDQREYSH